MLRLARLLASVRSAASRVSESVRTMFRSAASWRSSAMPLRPFMSSGRTSLMALPNAVCARNAASAGSLNAAIASAISSSRSSASRSRRVLASSPSASSALICFCEPMPLTIFARRLSIRTAAEPSSSRDDPDCSAAKPSCPSDSTAMPVFSLMRWSLSPDLPNAVAMAMPAAMPAEPSAVTRRPMRLIREPNSRSWSSARLSPSRNSLSSVNSSTNASPAFIAPLAAMCHLMEFRHSSGALGSSFSNAGPTYGRARIRTFRRTWSILTVVGPPCSSARGTVWPALVWRWSVNFGPTTTEPRGPAFES